jgi:hypothetical protein
MGTCQHIKIGGSQPGIKTPRVLLLGDIPQSTQTMKKTVILLTGRGLESIAKEHKGVLSRTRHHKHAGPANR